MPHSVSTKTPANARDEPRILLGLSKIMPKVSRRWLQNGHNTPMRNLDDFSLSDCVHEPFSGRARCPRAGRNRNQTEGAMQCRVGSWRLDVPCFLLVLVVVLVLEAKPSDRGRGRARRRRRTGTPGQP